MSYNRDSDEALGKKLDVYQPVESSASALSNLLPCPFCGEAPHVTPRMNTYGPRISCRNVDCRLGNITCSFDVSDWNKRAR